MKTILVSLLSLSFILASCSPSEPTTLRSPLEPGAIAGEDRSIFKEGLVDSQQLILDGLQGASFYRIDFYIAEDFVHVTGHEQVRYTNTETVPLNEVRLRLFPNVLGGKMDVSNILVNEKPISPKLELNNSLLILPFAAPLETGQGVVIKMDFSVEVPQSVEQNYGVIAYADGVLALAHAYPMICVYDDEGWNAEIPRNYGDVTYTDASFYLVNITAPQGVTLVSTGREISHREEGPNQVSSIANGPARDFFLAASSNYQEITRTVGSVTLRSYALAEQKTGAEAVLRSGAQALEDFNQLYGAYPYSELDFVSTPTNAGGIEYPGLVVVASRLYDELNNPSDASSSVVMEAVTAHEVAHQWFYNLVGDDQLDEPWLDEAFAQFATLQYFRQEYGIGGEQGFRNSLEGRWQRVEGAMIPIGLPVAAYTAEQYGAIVYGRGPLFLVALQREMGDAVFEDFLQDYVKQLSWKIATPNFMQALAEKHCSCNLDALFIEWVFE